MAEELRWAIPGRLMFALAAVWLAAASPASAQGPVAPPSGVTFTKHIAPVLQRSCVRCHKPDSIAPMSLLTYEQARPYARAMKQRTALARAPYGRGAMPPWFYEKNLGIQKIKDDLSLSDEEIALFAAWADSGAPQGNPADMPPPLKFADTNEWTQGKPDLIVSSPKFVVPAVGPDRAFSAGTTPTGLTEDRYVAWAEAKERGTFTKAAGGKIGLFVIHHASVNARPPRNPGDDDAAAADNDAGDDGTSGATNEFRILHEVGRNGDVFPEDGGRLLRAESSLSFPGVHIHSSGTERTAWLDVGMRLHPKGYKPKYEVIAETQGRGLLEMTPGDANIRGDSYWVADKPFILTNFEPHMHATAVRMCLEAIYGRVTETLACSGYDHNWVRNYWFEDNARPILPKGTILHSIGWFDNTEKNANIVDPRNVTTFGQSSTQNMFNTFHQLIMLTDEQYLSEVAKRREYAKRTGEPILACPACNVEPAVLAESLARAR